VLLVDAIAYSPEPAGPYLGAHVNRVERFLADVDVGALVMPAMTMPTMCLDAVVAVEEVFARTANLAQQYGLVTPIRGQDGRFTYVLDVLSSHGLDLSYAAADELVAWRANLLH
jgi:hypothetical protein